MSFMDIPLDKTPAFNVNSRENNEFIKWFHQSRIPNLQKLKKNICDYFFFNWQTEKKRCFETKQEFRFLF